MATTTAIRFSTQARPSSIAELSKWARKKGFNPKDKTFEQLNELYDTYNKELFERVAEHGDNPNIVAAADDTVVIEQKRLRHERLRDVRSKMRPPFLIPASPAPPDIMSFNDFVEQQIYLNYCVYLLSLTDKKEQHPFTHLEEDLAEFAAQQYNLSFCKTTIPLIVPYHYIKGHSISFSDLTPSLDETERLLSRTFGQIPAQDIFDTLTSEVAENAESLADQIRACSNGLVMIDIFLRAKIEGQPHFSRHATVLILNKDSGEAVYFDPHMENSSIRTNLRRPYAEIRSIVESYLKRIDPTFRITKMPAFCSTMGVGPIQGLDRLCASWSFYFAMCNLLNPDLPVEAITDSISPFSVARMAYCLFYFTPLRVEKFVTIDIDPSKDRLFMYQMTKFFKNKAATAPFKFEDKMLETLKNTNWSVALDRFSTQANRQKRATKKWRALKLPFNKGDTVKFRWWSVDGHVGVVSRATKKEIDVDFGDKFATIPQSKYNLVKVMVPNSHYECETKNDLPRKIRDGQRFKATKQKRPQFKYSVSFPKGVVKIPNNAFETSYLTLIDIPIGVRIVGTRAFHRCSDLSEITLPEGVTNIEPWAFSECKGLTSVELPDTVNEIGKFAFYMCETLENIDLPKLITKIEDDTFAWCKQLKTVAIPEQVTEIGNAAFYSCKALEEVTFSERLTQIGDAAFAGTNLSSVTIPKTVAVIHAAAFHHCLNLQEVIISKGVEDVGKSTFESCSSLVSVTIPDSVKSIGASCFYACTSLVSVTMAPKRWWSLSIEEGAFQNCVALQGFGIPVGVTTIEKSVFEDCKGLKSISIPDGVTVIKDRAFFGCGNLKTIKIPVTVTKIGEKAFWGCTGLTEIKVARWENIGKNTWREKWVDFLNLLEPWADFRTQSDDDDETDDELVSFFVDDNDTE